MYKRAIGSSSADNVKDIKSSSSPQTVTSYDSDSPSEGEKQSASDVYALGGQGKFYEPIPEYEGRHRWDPHAEWTEQEEKSLIRKVHILLFKSLKSLTLSARLSDLLLGLFHVLRFAA